MEEIIKRKIELENELSVLSDEILYIQEELLDINDYLEQLGIGVI